MALLAHGDSTETDAVGTIGVDEGGLDGGAPVTPDTIFRIASITKPVAAAAAMLLVDFWRCAAAEQG